MPHGLQMLFVEGYDGMDFLLESTCFYADSSYTTRYMAYQTSVVGGQMVYQLLKNDDIAFKDACSARHCHANDGRPIGADKLGLSV